MLRKTHLCLAMPKKEKTKKRNFVFLYALC